jgi:hypothetical protein
MKISELIQILNDARTEYGDLPVVAMIGKYGDDFSEIDSVSLESDDRWPNGCLHLE